MIINFNKEIQKEFLPLQPGDVPVTFCNTDKLKNDFEILSILRNLKIIGIFSRLKYRDHKPKYMDLIKNAWNFINLHLEDPSFSELKSWISVYKNKFL